MTAYFIEEVLIFTALQSITCQLIEAPVEKPGMLCCHFPSSHSVGQSSIDTLGRAHIEDNFIGSVIGVVTSFDPRDDYSPCSNCG